MGGIASAAITIASTVSAGGPATIDPPAIILPAAPPPARPYVIIDLPRPAGDRMAAAVSDVVRLDADGGLVVEAPPPAPADVDAEVIAAHESRIAAIRERIDTVREAPGRTAAPQLADLTARLHRAEAARKLALTRQASAVCTTCSAKPTRTVQATPAPVRVAATALRRQQQPPLQTVAVTQPPRSHPASTTLASAQSLSNQSPPHATPEPAAESLAKARALLAKARAALEAPPAAAPAPITLAGLWQWDGSDRWSLAAGPSRIA